ncbi:MAG: hypothetical protein LBT65_06065 [Synergistaceae bacterium]|jgi:hypothetical protein|nr:hypothetical protein [Synergistaceae bacterium]
MDKIASRYANITGKFPRELLLLRGTGCFHKKCLFCDYYLDACDDPFPDNRSILDMATGEHGTLDIIDSGSVHELDAQTLDHIKKIVLEKNVRTLWFEAHYAYYRRLEAMRSEFPGTSVKFRTGIESFDPEFRRRMNKGVPHVSPEEIRGYFDGVCLLVGVEGQTRDMIRRDVDIASGMFEYFSVNVFCPNSTSVKQDVELTKWFEREMYPRVKDMPNCEVLLNNTDLGVG